MTPPLCTLFSTAKPFRGHAGLIQRNALASWARLSPPCPVLLFGNDPGSAEACTELGLTHVPAVAVNEKGTPRIDDLFRQAAALAGTPLLAYVNADIILLDDFTAALRAISSRRRPFLLCGQRRDLDLREPLEFTGGWQGRLAERARQDGRLHPASGIDYFVFRRDFWKEGIPAFAVGRPTWDNWMLYAARAHGADLVDATEAVTAIHQEHDYGHRPGGEKEVWEGDEAVRNRALSSARGLSIDDATHRLTPIGVRPALDWPHLRRRLNAWPLSPPALRFPMRCLNKAVRLMEGRP